MVPSETQKNYKKKEMKAEFFSKPRNDQKIHVQSGY